MSNSEESKHLSLIRSVGVKFRMQEILIIEMVSRTIPWGRCGLELSPQNHPHTLTYNTTHTHRMRSEMAISGVKPTPICPAGSSSFLCVYIIKCNDFPHEISIYRSWSAASRAPLAAASPRSSSLGCRSSEQPFILNPGDVTAPL